MIPVDVSSIVTEERAFLEGRWQINRRSLANARNRVATAVASLDCIVADRQVIEAMIGRWVIETFAELDRLDLEGELPRGSAAALAERAMPMDALDEAMEKLASPLTRVEELPAAERAAFEAAR